MSHTSLISSQWSIIL